MSILASYTRKWLIYVLTFFLFFTTVLLVSEYFHEKRFRIDALNDKLEGYTRLINGYVKDNRLAEKGRYESVDTLIEMLSNEAIRVTLIDLKGKVLFDSKVRNSRVMENHLNRPEIQKAITGDYGTSIRLSGTTKNKYYYYAKRFDGYFIRVSDLYDINARKLIQPDRVFILFIVLIFFAASFTIVLVTDKFGQSISTLREFTEKVSGNKPIDEKLVFPENELGSIGREIIGIYRNLNRTKEELLSERAKLIRHLNMLEEGYHQQ
jgi:two-component system OmpR family sensor kinase/two-component system phosphate regulon sensor histidine kinase PhoR